MDNDYWKHAYKDTWADSSAREKKLAAYIEERTHLTVVESGLGAGSDAFISGSAQQNGYSKGDADLHIEGTNIYIEVTGPLVSSVSPDKPLWFRPDKLNNAIRKMKAPIPNNHDTFLAHHTPSKNLWRIIHVDQIFSDRCFDRIYQVVTPTIKGRKERYVEIPANDPCITDLEGLIQYIITHAP